MCSSILLTFIGLILTIPVCILEIIILFRAADKLQRKNEEKITKSAKQAGDLTNSVKQL